MKLFKPRISRSIGLNFSQQWNDLLDGVVLAKAVSSLFTEYWREAGHGHCQRPLAC